MRKIFTSLSLIVILILVGCSTSNPLNSTNNGTTNSSVPNNTGVTLNEKSSLAFSTYMAGGLLSISSSSTLNLSAPVHSYKLVPLTDSTTTTEVETTLEVENDLEEVNHYFDKLKVFMDNGVDSVLNVTEQASTLEGYDFEITYSIEGVTYTIYYSFINNDVTEPVDETTDPTDDVTTTVEEETTTTDVVTTTNEEQDEDNDQVVTTTEEDNDEDDEDRENNEFQLVGLMIINGINYELTGANEIDGDEQKMWFETIDSTDSGNYVKVEIKTENGEQKFELESVIDGVQSNSEIKFEEEENETKVELKLIQGDVESSYEFKKEVEDGKVTYKFEYQIGDVQGEIKVIEMTDVDGNITYKYDIEEDGKHKEIEKGKPDKDKEDKDSDETDDEDKEDDSETEVDEVEESDVI